jgi:hypothetical protein
VLRPPLPRKFPKFFPTGTKPLPGLSETPSDLAASHDWLQARALWRAKRRASCTPSSITLVATVRRPGRLSYVSSQRPSIMRISYAPQHRSHQSSAGFPHGRKWPPLLKRIDRYKPVSHLNPHIFTYSHAWTCATTQPGCQFVGNKHKHIRNTPSFPDRNNPSRPFHHHLSLESNHVLNAVDGVYPWSDKQDV